MKKTVLIVKMILISFITVVCFVATANAQWCILDPKFEETTLTQGMEYYADRTYTLTSVPSQYVGRSAIKTPNNERNSTVASGYMRFTLASPTTVYVAYDSRISTLPAWMGGFTDTGERILTSLRTQPSLSIYAAQFPAGCVDLGANKASPASAVTASNYIVIYGPPPTCTLDPKFEETTLTQGMKYYTDREYTLTDVPSQYVGLSMIKTPNNERNLTMATGYMTFSLSSPTTVYVAYDSRVSVWPAWMRGFTDTGDRILTSLRTQPSLIIYGKHFPAGCVDLGANKASPASAVTASNYVVLLDYSSCPCWSEIWFNGVVKRCPAAGFASVCDEGGYRAYREFGSLVYGYTVFEVDNEDGSYEYGNYNVGGEDYWGGQKAYCEAVENDGFTWSVRYELTQSEYDACLDMIQEAINNQVCK